MRIPVTIAERANEKSAHATRGLRRPQDVVTWFGAMQAQEYEPAKWAVGLRMADGTANAKVQRACDQGRIVRTHVMRPTWHFVASEDIRWLLELTAPRVHRILSYYNRALELDARTLTRATAIIERALAAGEHLTRVELAESLSQARLPMSGNRLGRVVMHAELEARHLQWPSARAAAHVCAFGRARTARSDACRPTKLLRRWGNDSSAATARRRSGTLPGGQD